MITIRQVLLGIFSCPTLASLQSPTDHVRVYHENPIAREIRHTFIMQKRKKIHVLYEFYNVL